MDKLAKPNVYIEMSLAQSNKETIDPKCIRDALSFELIDLIEDEIISITGFSKTPETLKEVILDFFKESKIKLAAFAIVSDLDGQISGGYVNSKKATFKKSIEHLSKLSSRVTNGMQIRNLNGSSLLDFLKEHSVNPNEVFLGERHLDRCLFNREYDAVGHFIDFGIPVSCKVVRYSTVVPQESYLIHELLDAECYHLVKMLIEKGEDIYLVDKYGNTFLHYIGDCSPEPEMVDYFVSLGIDVNQVNNHGSTPLMETVKIFCLANSAEDLDDDPGEYCELINILEIYIKNGATLSGFDIKGAGVLLYARNHLYLRNWIKERDPQLALYDESMPYDQAVISTLRSRPDQIAYYEECLKEKINIPFETPDFQNFLIGSHGNSSLDITKNAAIRASELVELACRYNVIEPLVALQRLGFPALMICYAKENNFSPPFSGGNSLQYALKNDANVVINYLNTMGITSNDLDELKVQLHTFIESANDNHNEVSFINEHCSKDWIAFNSSSWEKRAVDERGMFNTVDKYLSVRLKSLLNHGTERLINNAFGNNIFLGWDSGCIQRINGKFKVVLLDEVLDSIKLNLEIESRVN